MAVAQSLRVLDLSRRCAGEQKGAQTLARYQDLALLDIVDCYRMENPIESFAPRSYLRIVEGDQRNNTNNCYVAQCYILNGCSIAQTAKQLFMHKNSVLYRIERIKSLYGLSFSDPGENQLFLVACLMHDLQEGKAILPGTAE